MAEKKGLLGGNLLPKILILIAVGIFVSVVIFGIPASIPDWIWTIVRVVLGIGVFVFAIKIMEKAIVGKLNFSPTDSWRRKIIRVAEMSRPPRMKKLWMRGEDMHIHYYFGKITGLLFIPNWAGIPIIDKKTGKFLYVHKHDRGGKPEYDNSGNPVMVNQMMNINEKDGDWLFIISRGWFPALSKKILVRANVNFCQLGEECWIKTVNLAPVGDYYYPNQQWQADIVRINMQHLAEAVEETYMHFLDLCATTTESSLRSDPMFVKMLQSNTESISQKESAPIQDLGRRG